MKMSPLIRQRLNLTGQMVYIISSIKHRIMSNQKKVTEEDLSLHMGDIEYRQMRPSDKAAIVPLLAEVFGANQPLNVAFAAKHKISKAQKLKKDIELWDMWFDDANNTSLSSVIIDHSKNGQIVGTVITQDAGFKADNVAKILVDNHTQSGQMTFGQAYLLLENALKQKVPEEIRKILETPGKAAYAWGAITKPEYRGRNLAAIGALHGYQLAYAHGYTYGYCMATNINTIRAGKKIAKKGLQIPASIDVKEFEIEGSRPFELVDEDNRYARLLVHKLREDDKKVEISVRPRL